MIMFKPAIHTIDATLEPPRTTQQEGVAWPEAKAITTNSQSVAKRRMSFMRILSICAKTFWKAPGTKVRLKLVEPGGIVNQDLVQRCAVW